MNTSEMIEKLERLLALSAEHGDPKPAAIAQTERDVGEYAAAVVTALWSLPGNYRLSAADAESAHILIDHVVEARHRDRAREYLARLTA